MSRPVGRMSSGNANTHPYLRPDRYDELFGHLYRETSSPSWKKRMEEQREAIRNSKKSFTNHFPMLRK